VPEALIKPQDQLAITSHQASSNSQLFQFKLFVCSLKSADTMAQILPIRSNIHIPPISTSDQLNGIETVVLMNYFKPYKRTQKHMSGDFHIATRLSFNESKEHLSFKTWLLQNGYSTMISSCQTSDMVRLGFLSRARGFTYRDDRQEYITSSQQWKDRPFHFRMYFDAFTTKGRTAHVLMIDVDHPNIDIGMQPLSLVGQAFVRFMNQFLIVYKTITYFCGKDN
jgi:hypothetical protein